MRERLQSLEIVLDKLTELVIHFITRIANLLIHFNPKLLIVMACDASNYGIGAVLAHCMSDCSKHPIAYVSRSLTKEERDYSQVQKEQLSFQCQQILFLYVWAPF